MSCEACGVSVQEMNARRRMRAPVALARQIAIYLSHVVGQLSIPEASIAFDRDRTTVAYACHIIEDRRDSKLFDAQIEVMEREMRARLDRMFRKVSLCGAPTELDVKVARMNLARARTGT